MKKTKNKVGAPPHARSANLINRGLKLKTLRIQRGLSQIAMDEELGENTGTYGRWERATKNRELTDAKVNIVCENYDLEEVLFYDTVSLQEFAVAIKDVEYVGESKHKISSILDHNQLVEIPCNLPREPIVFVGRKKELSQLLHYLSPENRDFRCAITGIGGVGKSALALKAAWQCVKEKKFNAVVWFSAKKEFLLDNQISKKRFVNTNLGGLLSAIIDVLDERTSKNLPSESEQLKIVKSLLASYKTLVIIDNLETIDDDEVRIFIREIPAPSEILITDRKSVSVENIIPLTELSSAETKEVILDHCKTRNCTITNNNIEKIAEYIGGVPLALEWAIGQISSQHWNIEKFHTHLQERENSPLLEILFLYSWEKISYISKEIITFLSYLPAPISGREIKKINKISQAEFNDALIELLRFALVVSINRDTNRSDSSSILQDSYKLLSLTKFFVRKIGEADKRSIINKTGEYFLQQISSNDSLPLWPSDLTLTTVSKYYEIYIWLVEESFDAENYRFILDLMTYISPALGRLGKHDSRLKLSQIAIDSAIRTNNKKEQARNLIMGTGWVLGIWEALPESKEAVTKGIALAQDINDVWLEAVGIRTLGLLAIKANNYQEAEDLLKQCEAHFIQLKDEHFLSITYDSLATLTRRQGDFKAAERYCDKAIKKLKTLADSEELLSIAYHEKAKISLDLDELDIAEENNEKAQDIAHQINRTEGKAHCEHISALIAEKRGNIKEALEHILNAEELFSDCECKHNNILGNDLDRIQEKAKPIK